MVSLEKILARVFFLQYLRVRAVHKLCKVVIKNLSN